MEENRNSLKDLIKKDFHSTGLSIGLHLFPGILATALYIPLARFFWNNNIPTIFALYSSMILILIPFEYGILIYLSKKNNRVVLNFKERIIIPSIVENRAKNKPKTIIIFSLIALFWTVFILGFIDKQLGISVWIYENWFNWLPEYYTIASVYTNPENYSKGILALILVATLIFGAIIGPYVEELYFRGFLMPRIVKNKWVSPVLNAILFAFYHIWTPWMIPMRILALLPLTIFVWWKKDIKIGIYSHIVLNLMGDVILVIPLFFF